MCIFEFERYKMEFTKEEKELLKYLLKEHLKGVKNSESLRDQSPITLSAEIKFEDFLSKLIEKLD